MRRDDFRGKTIIQETGINLTLDRQRGLLDPLSFFRISFFVHLEILQVLISTQFYAIRF